jgi:hypothetical protein
MYTKTWKIGVCQGGIITVEIKNSAISVIIGRMDFLKMVLNVVVKAKLKSLHVKQF